MRERVRRGRAARAAAAAAALLALLAGCAGGPAADRDAASESPADGDGEGGSAGADGGTGAGGSGGAGGPGPGPEEPEPEPSLTPAPATGSAEVAETVAEGLADPCCLAPLPDGGALVGARDGTLSRVSADGETTELGTVREVAGAGLLGLAVSPGFGDTDDDVYVAYATSSDTRVERIIHYPDNPPGDQLGWNQPTLVSGLPTTDARNGGALAFGPDGMLYVGTGDAQDSALAQDPESEAGKILRIEPTGQIPSDNPLGHTRVYSLGHGDVRGLAWDEADRLWAVDAGGEAGPELYLVAPGGDHGWPERGAGALDPVHTWDADAGTPAGLAFHGGSLWVPTREGADALWRLPLAGPELVDGARPEAFLGGEFAGLRGALAPPGGAGLLLLTDDGLVELAVS